MAAQTPAVTLRGVVSGPGGVPVAGALVYVDSSTVFQLSDSAGDFRVTGLDPGPHTLHLRKLGLAPSSLHFTLPDSAAGVIDVGLISLSAGQPPVLRVRGRVRDAATDQPVVAVAVGLNGQTRAATNNRGEFSIASAQLAWGPNVIEVRRIGFEPIADQVWITQQETDLELTVNLRPLPVRLGEVVVEGDRTVIAFGRLAEFYRRRRTGLGRYITSWDIERQHAYYASDLLRNLAGLSVVPGAMGSRTIRSRRAYYSCSPVVFVDGMKLWQGLELDDVVFPEHIAGIEVYSGPAQVPPEFNTFGSQCGVIAVWTK